MIMMIADLTIVIETINATIALVTTIRTQQVTSPTKRKMIASMITSRKKTMRPCTMTSPPCQVWAICPEEVVVLAQDLLCPLVLGLALAQAAGATTTIT
jgi:hypothetical protein